MAISNMSEIEEKRCVASWALLRKLYDNGQKDMYLIISDFIRYTIFKESLRSFDIFTLTQKVNNVFSVRLIDAVVKRALKKLQLPCANGIFSCNPCDYGDMASFSTAINETTATSNEMLERLVSFVEGEIGETLTLEEREKLMKSFNLFMLDKRERSEYAELIAKFIIICNSDEILKSQLNGIKEGVVLYSGLNYNAKTENASKKWTEDITVFLDTEVLFHMAGYNGETYKQLFDDFFGMVNEINSDSINKTGKKKIKMSYFEQTQDEVANFFQIAEDIVNGKVSLIPSVTAMSSIIKGCKSASDVAERKVDFEKLIKAHGINIDDKPEGYYSDDDRIYNIENSETVDKYKELLPKAHKKDIANSLVSLSHIFVLRKGKIDTYFEKSKYILLTDNYITRLIAWDESIKELSGNVLCTDLYYFTDRLWCRLGKSFGLNASPKVYDVISRAQIFLSSRINTTITDEYENLLRKYKNKEIDKEQVLEVLSELRSKVMKPEDIQTESNADAALEAISGRNIESYIQDKERKELEYQQVLSENKNLAQKLEEVRVAHERQMQEKSVLMDQKLQEAEVAKMESQHQANLQIATAQTMYEWKERILSYKEIRDGHIRNKIISAYKSMTCQIISFVLFVGLTIGATYLVEKYNTQDICWYWKALLIVGSTTLSQAIPIYRTIKFGAADIQRECLYIFKRKAFPARRSLMENMPQRPSWNRLFEDKLNLLEGNRTKADS